MTRVEQTSKGVILKKRRCLPYARLRLLSLYASEDVTHVALGLPNFLFEKLRAADERVSDAP